MVVVLIIISVVVVVVVGKTTQNDEEVDGADKVGAEVDVEVQTVGARRVRQLEAEAQIDTVVSHHIDLCKVSYKAVVRAVVGHVGRRVSYYEIHRRSADVLADVDEAHFSGLRVMRVGSQSTQIVVDQS